MIQDGGAEPGAVRGRLKYAQPALDRIARRATSRIVGLRMEPPGSGNLLERLLLCNPVSWFFGRLRGELSLDVPVQVARGWRIPELCKRAQAAIAEEARRLTHYRRVVVNVHVSGTFSPDESFEP